MASSSVGVPEWLLVREVLHCCQGINGKYVWFQGSGDGGRFACGPGTEVSVTQQQLISKISELGWLLRKIRELTSQIAGLHSLVHEALAAASHKEVNNYYRLVAILEAQTQQQAGSVIAAAGGTDMSEQLTLRRLQVWLSEPLYRLRVLATCLESTRLQQGAQVINTLHAMSKHGDPLVRKVLGPLLEDVCMPYFKLVSQWVLDGGLDGTSDDFFIARQPLATDAPANVWRSGFALVPALQPRFFSDELPDQILKAGKTINFLRVCCSDTEWVGLVGDAAQQLAGATGKYRQLRCACRCGEEWRVSWGGRGWDTLCLCPL
jgi:gamma-tubulin complex component 3